MQLIDLVCYPIKSIRGNSRESVDLESRGLAGDRRWMLIDEAKRFVSARKLPRLLRFGAEAVRDGLIVFAPDGRARHIGEPTAEQPLVPVSVWNSACTGRIADAESNAWFSNLLGTRVQLVHMADDCQRAVDPEFARPDDIVSYADGFPLLLIGTASLAALNERLQQPVAMANFRPNLVVGTDQPHIEDDWKQIRIGECLFDVVKPCTRCVLTTIDPDSAEARADGEPLNTLKTYRRSASGVTFGQNLLVRGGARLQRGDTVTVVE